jgi:hypothetical protein
MGSGRVLLMSGNVAQLSALIDQISDPRTNLAVRVSYANQRKRERTGHTAVIREGDLKLGVEPGPRHATWWGSRAAIGNEFRA